MDKMI